MNVDYEDLEWRMLAMAEGGYSFSGLDTGRMSRPSIPIYNIDRHGKVVRGEMKLEAPPEKK